MSDIVGKCFGVDNGAKVEDAANIDGWYSENDNENESDDFVAIWARDTLGLSEMQYRKSPFASLLLTTHFYPPPDKTHKQQKTSKNPCVPRRTEITHARECPLWAYALRGVGPLPLPKGQDGSHRHHPFQQIPRSSIRRPPAHLLSIYFRRYLRQLIATLDQGVKEQYNTGTIEKLRREVVQHLYRLSVPFHDRPLR